jgi:alkylhydroperoxidase family enzyme
LVRGDRALPPLQAALAEAATVLTERPRDFGESELAALRAAGLSERGVAQAAAVIAFFNYVTRCADALGLELDYESALERLRIDANRPARARGVARPALDRPADRPGLSLLPRVSAAWREWRTYLFERDRPLSRAERAAVACAVADALGDAPSSAALRPIANAGGRIEAALPYAVKLTLRQWSATRDDLDALRAAGMDDAALLDLVSVIASQNAFSRLELAVDCAPLQRQ